jgi:translation elongation factor EF-Tu-like GTPase
MENYRPQLFLRTADITVSLKWPEGTADAAEKMIMPGDSVEMVCDLVHDAAAEVGTRFTLREGGKTSKHLFPCLPNPQSSRTLSVGTGIVTKLLQTA